MKTFLSILAGILFVSIFFVPDEDAPLRVYFEWALWSVGALFVCNLIFKASQKWDKDTED